MATTSKAAREREAAQVQAATNETDALVPEEDRARQRINGAIYVPLRDEEFALRKPDEVSLFPLMQWAAADESGANLAALYRILVSLIHPEDMPRFGHFAMDAKPRLEIKDYVAFQNVAFEALSANPTEQPVPSSDTSSGTSAGSTATSSRRRAAASKA